MALRRIVFGILLATALATAGCETGPSDPPVERLAPATADPTNGWPRATPAQVGISESRIHALIESLRQQPGALRSLLVVRDGYLVTEEYFNGNGPEVLHTLQSVTKSVTALAAGAAAQRGRLTGTESVLTYFSDYASIRNLDANKQALRVEDLLTMRTGLDWSEATYETSPLKQLNECSCDWVRFVIDWPMRTSPGTQFEYNSGGVIVLGDVVARAVGVPFTSFIRDNLFTPLGIGSVLWTTGVGAVPHTGGGLSLRAADLAKLGLLVLHGGVWEGRQVVDPAFLARATSVRTTTFTRWADRPWSYGYLFWLTSLSGSPNPSGDDVVITGSGALGQWLFVVPRYHLVVVANSTSLTYAGFVAPAELLFSEILPAISP